MNFIVKTCVYLHKTIFDARDTYNDTTFGTKCIASVDDDTDLLRKSTRSIYSNLYAHAE